MQCNYYVGSAKEFTYIGTMSFAEIKQQIPALAPEERLELAG